MAGRQAVDLVKATGDTDTSRAVTMLLMILRLIMNVELIMAVFDAVTDAGQAAYVLMGS